MALATMRPRSRFKGRIKETKLKASRNNDKKIQMSWKNPTIQSSERRLLFSNKGSGISKGRTGRKINS